MPGSEKKKKKYGISTWILVLIMLIGAGIMLYPTVSDYWNSFHQSRAIASYVEQVTDLSEETNEEMWNAAVAYNEKLAETGVQWNMDEEQTAEYKNTLDVTGTGIMGYIKIPAINVSLPIYHTTDEAILQIAIGHIQGSSLPVGGKGSHCVISGHTGLPSAKLFTDIDQLVEGDTFEIYVLDQKLTYEVDQIKVVLPEEMEDLAIDPEQDYVTLVTCTPYGINTHRLLVRGHRIDNIVVDPPVANEATEVPRLYVILFLMIPVMLIALLYIHHVRKKKNL